MLSIPFTLDSVSERNFIENNPNSYVTYMALGDYYKKNTNYVQAIKYYKQSLGFDVASKNEFESIKGHITECEKKQNSK